MIYAVYYDDGPSELGGQFIPIISHGDCLLKFQTVEAFLEYRRQLENTPPKKLSRRNPRIGMVYSDDLEQQRQLAANSCWDMDPDGQRQEG